MEKKKIIFVILFVVAVVVYYFYSGKDVPAPVEIADAPPTSADTPPVVDEEPPTPVEVEKTKEEPIPTNESVTHEVVNALVDSTIGNEHFDLNVKIGVQFSDKGTMLHDFTSDIVYSKGEDFASISPFYEGKPLVSLLIDENDLLYIDTHHFDQLFYFFSKVSTDKVNPLFNSFIKNNQSIFDTRKEEAKAFLLDVNGQSAQVAPLPPQTSPTINVPILYMLDDYVASFLKAYGAEHYKDGVLTIDASNLAIGLEAIVHLEYSDEFAAYDELFNAYSEKDLHRLLFDSSFGVTPEEFLEEPVKGVSDVLRNFNFDDETFVLTIKSEKEHSALITLHTETSFDDLYDLTFELSKYEGEPITFEGKSMISEDNVFLLTETLDEYIEAFEDGEEIGDMYHFESHLPSNRLPLLVDRYCVFENDDCVYKFLPSMKHACFFTETVCQGYTLYEDTGRFHPLEMFDKVRSQPSAFVAQTTTREGRVIYTNRVEQFVDETSGIPIEGVFSFYYDENGFPQLSSLNLVLENERGYNESFESYAFFNNDLEVLYAIRDDIYQYYGFYDTFGAFHKFSDEMLERQNPRNLYAQ